MSPHKHHGRRWMAAVMSLALTAGGVLTTTSAAHAADPLPQPVLRYTFDDPAGAIANAGTGGAALDGIIRNGTTLPRGTGPVASAGMSGKFPGSALGAPATSPWVEIPTGLFDGAKELTVSTWIKWDGRFADQLPWSFIVGGDGVPANNWGLYYQPNEDNKSKAVANTGNEVKAEGPRLGVDQWTYLTMSANATSITYYINGVRVGSQPVEFDVTRLSSPSSTFSGLLGRVQWSGDYAAYFPGEFDDFSVYREALDAADVAELFQQYTGNIVQVAQTSFEISTPQGVAPQLPTSVGVTYSSGSTVDLPINWAPVPATAYATSGTSFPVVGTLAGWDGKLTATVQVQARGVEDFAVDFSRDTGEFRGGASGTLYGLGDEQSPTQALVNGAAMTNISQKPPYGTQHPGGDVFHVEKPFFDKWGEDLYVYTQDYYPDWPYHGGQRPGDVLTYTKRADGSWDRDSSKAGPDGVWDYLQVLDLVVDEVARKGADPSKYIFIPFNEPDWIWYGSGGGASGEERYRRYLLDGGQPDSGTPNGVSDWKAAYDVIEAAYARHGLARPKVAGPGDAAFRGEGRMRDFLTAAREDGAVPDVFVWHELNGYNWLPDRMVEYRRAVAGAGIPAAQTPLVNITEYGAISDMSAPSSLLTWFASFEAAKVDAQTAYWTASGTMSDNQAKVNSANGGWWLFNWYGDLHGSRTVQVTRNERNAIAGIDTTNKRAQVILGGVDLGKDAQLSLAGLDRAVFGDAVDIEVRENRIGGTDGEAGTPRLVAAADGVAVTGAAIRIPVSDENSVYQVVITPATARDVSAELRTQPAQYVIEAEDTQLTGAEVRANPGSGYKASNGRDVRNFDTVDSRSDWTVSVAQAGLYRFQVIGATPGVPVEHALFVDGSSPQTVRYGANAVKPGSVQSTARGSADVLIPLTAGEHTLSLRTSQDGQTLLPNAGHAWDTSRGVTLDRFSLTRIGDTVNTESSVNPATTLRLADGASMVWDAATGGWAQLGDGGRVDSYPATYESGYHDLSIPWVADAGAELTVTVNGRVAKTFTADGKAGVATVRVHLPEGISEVELSGGPSVRVQGVLATRAVDGDAAIVRVEAEDLSKVTLGGTAAVQAFGTGPTDGLAGTGGGTGYVRGLGITDRDPANEGTMTVARGAGFDRPGEYDAIVHYSNDSIEGTHSYNPQVVDLGLQGREGDAADLAGRSTFRYTYLAANFWEAVMPLSLTTGDSPVEFGNTRETLFIDEGPTGSASDDVAVPGYAIAPNVDWIAFAPFVLDDGAATPVTVTPSLTADTPANAAGWYRSTVSVSFTDDASDATVEYRVGGTGVWTAATAPLVVGSDGTTTVQYRAVRGGAPVSGSQGEVTVELDRAAPVTSVQTDPASGSATSGGTVTARFSAVDETSGVQRTEYSLDGGATWTAATDAGVAVTRVGSTAVQYRSVDVAGNVEPARSVTLTVAQPGSGAIVSITSSGAPSADGWYRQPVLVKLEPAKAGQRVQYRMNGGAWRNASSTPLTVGSNGVTTLDHRLLVDGVVVDGSPAQTVVKIDRQVPVATITRTPGAGSPRNPIAMTFAGTDALSGVEKVEYQVDSGEWTAAPGDALVFDAVGTHLVSYRVVDEAGNTSPVRSTTVTVRENTATSVKTTVRTTGVDAPFTVVLAGFQRWDDVTLTIGGQPVATVLTDRDGAARVTVRVPDGTAPGAVAVVGTGTDGSTGTATLTVR